MFVLVAIHAQISSQISSRWVVGTRREKFLRGGPQVRFKSSPLPGTGRAILVAEGRRRLLFAADHVDLSLPGATPSPSTPRRLHSAGQVGCAERGRAPTLVAAAPGDASLHSSAAALHSTHPDSSGQQPCTARVPLFGHGRPLVLLSRAMMNWLAESRVARRSTLNPEPTTPLNA